MIVDFIAGARPNFMKIAPMIKAISKYPSSKIEYRLIHTGQHYDPNMSDTFFEQLGIPEPNINLGAGGGTQAEQTSKIMVGYEKLLLTKPCDLCIVVGDVTSTMACSIVAKKLNIKVAHVEAGIRSGDLTMPEEINRMVTDSISDYFFTTSEVANQNLKALGISENHIFFVGNTMIDSLLSNLQRFQKPNIWDQCGLQDKNYIVLTLHRPANVDQEANLELLINKIIEHSNNLYLVFPVHPRTRQVLNRLHISNPNLILTDPLPYLEFNYLVSKSMAVVTDSGGITEETTMLGIPCMTLRSNTERPETVSIGTNELLGTNPSALEPAMRKLLGGQWKKGGIPPLWDGKTSERIIEILIKLNLVSKL
jgi:UDP-N-acetylglucosamine 2-epimerase (non-hydrolysing)